MLRFMLAVATGAAVGAGGAWAVESARHAPGIEPASYVEEQQATPERLVIGIDISRSNPLVEDPAFAAKVAERVAGRVAGLGFRSEVHVRTLGNFDSSSNGFYYDTTISIRNRPDAVAAEIRKLIAGTPLLVRQGKWQTQANTNILAFLENVSQSFGCRGLPTTIILASDGIEDSEYARLSARNSHLPAPDAGDFSGCRELQILGLGQGTRSPIQTTRLRKEWSHWSGRAGFRKFTGLNDW